MKLLRKLLSIVIIAFFVLTMGIITIWIINASNFQKSSSEVLLMTSYSPDKKYKLLAYRTEPGATVDFSVKVYSVGNKRHKLVYNCYHKSTVDITWVDNSTVIINGVTLNMDKNDVYDWRKN